MEADETYYGKVAKENRRDRTTRGRPFTKKGRAANNRPIVALVEHGGSVRTFHVPVADASSVASIVRKNIDRDGERAALSIKGAEGKRLTYRPLSGS